MPALHAIVHGHVQGVGFRWFVSRRARMLSLAGHAANRADGTVEVYAEGAADALARLLEALREGPVGARVTAVDHSLDAAERGVTGFAID